MKNLILTITAVLFLVSCMPTAKEQQKEIDAISTQVAEDQIQQFNIAVKNGDAMQAYTQASLVTAAYLQAKDTTNYKKWREIEKKFEKKLGLDIQ
jgi:hypothetical protein